MSGLPHVLFRVIRREQGPLQTAIGKTLGTINAEGLKSWRPVSPSERLFCKNLN